MEDRFSGLERKIDSEDTRESLDIEVKDGVLLLILFLECTWWGLENMPT
jgi:hypothetical protein